MREQIVSRVRTQNIFPLHGIIGIGLVAVSWWLNWSLEGLRTHYLFFPLWLGYCLTIDALVFMRKKTSLLTRSWRKYVGLFLLSAPVWWLFEILNWRLQNWYYDGSENFSPLAFWFWATINFTTVIPAVFGSAEFLGSFSFLKRVPKGLIIHPTKFALSAFFLTGLLMFTLMLVWPRSFFPFLWLSIFFITEPMNNWLNRNSHNSLTARLSKGDWRPVLALWLGVLLTAFFWEMWNYLSYPKWIYQVSWGGCCKIFEMPLLGYGGYLPFALELHAVYQLLSSRLNRTPSDYLQIVSG